MLPSPKTLAHGLSKTRSGSPSIGIHELIGKVREGFEARTKKAVEEDEALDAAKLLSQKGRTRRYAEGGAIGGMTYPLVNAAGEAAKGFAAHAGQGKLRAAAHAAKAVLTTPELAKNVTRGVLGGGVIQAVREGVELGKAKRKVRDFIDERTGGKVAFAVPKPGQVSMGASHVGSFSGQATANFLKAPGSTTAGVTNPRLSIRNAMTKNMRT